MKSWLFAPCTDEDGSRSDYHGSGACGLCGMGARLDRDDELDAGLSEKRGYRVYYDQPRSASPIRMAPRSVSRGRLQKEKKEKKRARREEDDAGRRGRRRPQISSPFNFQHTSTGAVDFAPPAPRSAPLFRPLQLSILESSNQVSPLLPYFIGPNPAISQPARVHSRNQSRTENLPDVFDDDDATTLGNSQSHSRSHSDLSFHIPRRPVNDGSSFRSVSNDESPPRIPPRAAGRNRPRAYTSPSVERIVERIASALIERELLEAEIESVKERQSICLSRPSTSYDPGECSYFLDTTATIAITEADSVCEDEPMPAFPIVPPTAPSFAERCSIDRPRTAPSTESPYQPPPPPPPPPASTSVPVSTTSSSVGAPFKERAQSFDQPERKRAALTSTKPDTPSKQAIPLSAFNSHPPLSSPKIIDNSLNMDVPLAPPLPLILRPPLRKKKSFSRVADWLFPAGADKETTPGVISSPPQEQQYQAQYHRRDASFDSVTNTPRALTDRDGFYQTLPPSALFSGPRRSFDSESDRSWRRRSGSVYSTDEDGLQSTGGAGTMTVATSTQWSPGSTPPAEIMRKAHTANLSLPGTSVARSNTFGSEKSSPHEGLEGLGLRTRQTATLQGPRPTSVGVAF